MSQSPVTRGAVRVRVDREMCCAAGNCVLIAPEVFDQSEEDGQVVLVQSAPQARLWQSLVAAANACPVSAIDVRRDGT